MATTKKTRNLFLAVIGSLFILLNSCEKDSKKAPELTTAETTEITQTTAVSGGEITNDGNAYIIQQGVCWSKNENPTINDNKTANWTNEKVRAGFRCEISELEPNTTYYVRAFASNSEGTSYGNTTTFKTKQNGEDGDGNSYETVTIGTQTWMTENLKTTKYNDGKDIPLITENNEWNTLTTPGYCWYDNDEAKYKNTYGTLYNWYAVNTEKLCPVGWHVASNAEWVILITYLEGETVASNKLKQKGTEHWISPNEGATNETGFTALPGSYRDKIGLFGEIGDYGFWWTSTEDNKNNNENGWLQHMRYRNSYVYNQSFDKKLGASVRCIKD